MGRRGGRQRAPARGGARALASRLLKGWGAGRLPLLGRVAERWRAQVEKVCPTGLVMLPPYTIPPLIIQIGEVRGVDGAPAPEPLAPPPPVGVLYCGFSLEDIKTLFAATSQVYLGLSEIVFSAANMELTLEELEDFRANKTDAGAAGADGGDASDPYALFPVDADGVPATPADGDYAGGDYEDYR